LDQGLLHQAKYNVIVNPFMGDISPSNFKSQFEDFGQLAHTNQNAAASLQSCLTLCDPIDGSPPGFPVPGILQARTLEWVAISFSNA